jgi:Putative addiction module component
MDMTVLEAEALRLEPAARARLAERLFESLTTLVESETERLWIEEALARDEELESGAVEAVPADEVLRDARARLK